MDWATPYLEIALSVLGWGTLGLVIFVALLLDVLGLFGNWLILLAFGVTWAVTGFTHFGWLGLGGMLLLAVIGEVLETVVAGFGARKFGGSRGSMVAALVGCIAGAIFGTPLLPIPLLGTVVGACLGAFIAAALYDYIQHERNAYDAAWIGVGAAIGKVGGLFAKLFCGLLMLLVAAMTW